MLYGSGYVLLAFLRGDLVVRLGWLTQSQLLDAVSIGQMTPGPVFTTATFVGYLVAGLPGAVLATVGIFLPSFVFVALLTRIVDRIRERAWSAALLDGVNAAALALMAGVTVQLGRAALIDPLTVALGVAALLLLWRTPAQLGLADRRRRGGRRGPKLARVTASARPARHVVAVAVHTHARPWREVCAHPGRRQQHGLPDRSASRPRVPSVGGRLALMRRASPGDAPSIPETGGGV